MSAGTRQTPPGTLISPGPPRWGSPIVFAANMVGAFAFAWFMVETPAVSTEVQRAILNLGRHAADGGFFATAIQGVGAGFLIAVLVWMMATNTVSAFALIFLVTYVVAISGCTASVIP